MRQTHLLHSASYSSEGSPAPKVSPRRKISNHDFLTNFSSTASVDSGKMWSIFAEEIKEYDENVTNAQNVNIDSVLVFVSHNLLIVAPLITIGLKDWPLLCNRLRFYC